MSQIAICGVISMWRRNLSFGAIIRFTLVSTMLVLAGCTQTAPYRTTLLNPPYNGPFCEANASGVVANEECRSVTPEIGHSPNEPEQSDLKVISGYELHFVELDDQGWVHQKSSTSSPNPPEYCPQNSNSSTEQVMTGDAYCQLENLKHRLNELAEKGGVSIVLYVHGWHHNAELKDTNVQNFRQLLNLTYAAEQAKRKVDSEYQPKNVVGIYVGWRGESVSLFPFNYLTIWDRKNTAMHVAQGSSRELFTWLNAYQKRNNGNGNKKVRLILIGHSLGSLVVYSAVSGYLMEQLNGQISEMVDKQRQFGKCDENNRFADMVLLINPAQEGARYEPLYRMANDLNNACLSQQKYQPPLLVTVTTQTDWATDIVFPVSRAVSTFWEHGTSERQSKAIRQTYGHLNDYITHDLNVISNCTDNDSGMPDDAAKKSDTRTFCRKGIGVELKRKGNVPFSIPIWNVRADSSPPQNKEGLPNKGLVIDGHNGDMGELFMNFIGRLYHETASDTAQSPRQEGK